MLQQEYILQFCCIKGHLYYSTMACLCICIKGTACHYQRASRLCRDGADTDPPIYQMKRLIAPERYSYKPFQTYNKALRVFLYHIRPSKYVKYTDTMTYRNCHTSVFEYFFIIFFFFFKRSTSKLTNALTFILA